ncbi:MAG: L,D-transpeptidase family protein [Gammaproteobacteria bacterium]|nr:L,D-transpeptidase family protein [Gammaproteobacteria bacterium]
MQKVTISISLGLLLLVQSTVLAVTFPKPPEGDSLIGKTFKYTTQYEDTFSDIARFYGLGYRQLKAANPKVDPWLPGEGTEIIIPQQYLLPPGPHEGIIINLAELRLYYFPKDRDEVETYPLGIGREGWSTPVGETQIIGKKKDPSWTVPASILKEHEEDGDPLPPVVPPGPDNPLGAYALYLGISGYLLHGTNKPFGVGMRVSHGCIRLYPEDIEYFFHQVPIGTPVRIINQPYKAGWHNGELYVEAHNPLSEQVKEIGYNYTGLVSAVLAQLGEDPRKPEWSQLEEYNELKRGIPMPLYLWDKDYAENQTEKSPVSGD